MAPGTQSGYCKGWLHDNQNEVETAACATLLMLGKSSGFHTINAGKGSGFHTTNARERLGSRFHTTNAKEGSQFYATHPSRVLGSIVDIYAKLAPVLQSGWFSDSCIFSQCLFNAIYASFAPSTFTCCSPSPVSLAASLITQLWSLPVPTIPFWW